MIAVLISIFFLVCAIWIFIAVHKKNGSAGSELYSNQSILAALNQHMPLPNEAPTIATVSDLSKLHGQPFFQNAKVGDKVIIYAKAAEVILYRPSSNSVISVAPLTND